MTKISDSWQTPDWLFKQLDEEFNFSVDLCATLENKKCDAWTSDYLTTPDNVMKIQNCAFMNPPYSNPRPFIEKAWEDSKHCKIVCLVKCDPSTKWWATFWHYNFRSQDTMYSGPKTGCEVRFFPKRVKFDPPSGWEGKTSGPSFPSCILIFDRRNT